MSLQQLCRESESVQDSMLVKYSRHYRSILHECVLGLRKMAQGEVFENRYQLNQS